MENVKVQVYGNTVHVYDNVEIETIQPEVIIHTGTETNIICDKYFGPLIANAIRVHLDYDSVCWVIERERIVDTVKSVTKTPDGITIIDNDITTEWDEVARIDANVWEERTYEH